MKLKQREKAKENNGLENDGANESEGEVDSATADNNSSENRPPPPAPQPSHEKVLYDTRIRRKNVLALNEKVAAIREYEKSPVYKRVGRLFHCSPDQIKRIVQQKDSILQAWEQRTRRCHDAKTLEMKVVRVSMLGKAVYDWLRRMIYYQDIQITDGLIQKTALQFKSAMGLQNFFPHQDWCDKFRQTYKIYTMDSKLLKIGYKQGYSVQIKDVMKDVLNECTPDSDKRHVDNDVQEVTDESKKDEDASGGGELDGGMEVVTKRRRLKAGASATSTIDLGHNGNTSRDSIKNLLTAGNTAGNRVNAANPKLRNSNNSETNSKSSPQPVAPKPTASQLSPLRQLVALPLQGNVAGMPQKVLVATPITPAGQVSGGKPMTMTIIPLATIAQSQSMQTTSAAAVVTSTLTATTTANVATSVSATEKSAVPPPILEIKKEIKQEPVEIKQEYISDTDDDEQQQLQTVCKQRRNTTTTHNDEQVPTMVEVPSVPTQRTVTTSVDFVVSSGSEAEAEENGEPESADDENIALANLRRLIQTQGKLVATAKPTLSSKSTMTSPAPPLAPKPSLPLPMLTPVTATVAGRPQLPTATTAITCIPAANISAMTRSMNFTPPLPPLTKAPDAVINRLANKRKHATNNMPMLSPIKTCSEARKYLKLLEDFALVKENFRLIGLITRADEVLRELDGDDDVDVD